MTAVKLKFIAVLILASFLISPYKLGSDDLKKNEPGSTDALVFFSDPARIWGRGVEAAIEEAYRQCFKTFIIGERVMTLRMPFAQNNERAELAESPWDFIGKGKANPLLLWAIIGRTIESAGFALYAEAFSDGREKVIIFNIPGKSWKISRDLFDIARMKAGSYRGLPHQPYILTRGNEITQTDVYNYLYCVGWVGMDCSGFVWHVLDYTARRGGVDLGQRIGRSLGAPSGAEIADYAGTAFFNSQSPEIIAVDDRLSNLRPLDVILFRGEDGSMVHSAIIQSVDRAGGVIRYIQCTDEAPPAERGVHDSYIRFESSQFEYSLADKRLVWTQERYPPFPGEKASPFSDDGKRYRAFPEKGGGRVVRLRGVAPAVEKLGSRR